MKWTIYLAPLLVAAGCGGPVGKAPSPDDMKSIALEEVGEICRVYNFSRKKPPTKFADIASFQAIHPVGYDALKKGEIVLLYGAPMTATEEGPPSGTATEILAYEKPVPESGGKVLMLDRSIKAMTADEFKAAPKAGKP